MKQPPLAEDAIGPLLGLDADIVRRLARHLDLLRQWQRRINLIGASTLSDPWRRHVLDSAQLLPLLPPGSPRLIDLGSGAGFPGLVLAIAGDAEVTLVDADARKCAFLREAARLSGAHVQILNARIDSLVVEPYPIVTARALAPLERLLALARPLLAANGALLVLKGRGFASELTTAGDRWKMRVATWPSRTDPDGVVARIDDIGIKSARE
ncbi:MAG: 16S rRNA (guanine(527)-N(7))-methyltransferase RsmG [Rhodospirillales bacterium]